MEPLITLIIVIIAFPLAAVAGGLFAHYQEKSRIKYSKMREEQKKGKKDEKEDI